MSRKPKKSGSCLGCLFRVVVWGAVLFLAFGFLAVLIEKLGELWAVVTGALDAVNLSDGARAALAALVLIVIPCLIAAIVSGIKRLRHRRTAAKASKSQPSKPQTAAVSPAPVVSSTDKEDYDYAYDHIGLFRPQGTPGPMPPVGTQVWFVEEPSNPYDSDAVKAVWYHNGKKLLVGYMYRSDEAIRAMVRDWLARGDEYYAEIISTYGKPKLFIGFNR